jgi:WhiB family transcriptional regulator, redox-sensing transcriptional regulator
MTTAVELADWRSVGACVNADPDLFFPISVTGPAAEQIQRAKAVCASCQVRDECLKFALSHDTGYGIWGGSTAEERRRSRGRGQRRRRALALAQAKS